MTVEMLTADLSAVDVFVVNVAAVSAVVAAVLFVEVKVFVAE